MHYAQYFKDSTKKQLLDSAIGDCFEALFETPLDPLPQCTNMSNLVQGVFVQQNGVTWRLLEPTTILQAQDVRDILIGEFLNNYLNCVIIFFKGRREIENLNWTADTQNAQRVAKIAHLWLKIRWDWLKNKVS
mmetsp:Transcript_6278/g.23608  ORF Transcript_6278/g.23608 Transcript_6278/m.23608 type:complete len:133 (-) Transcript_6278:124-522(-)